MKIGRITTILLVIIGTLTVLYTARADVLGQSEIFFVNKQYDRLERDSLTATLRQVADNAYFYVDDHYWRSLSTRQQGDFMVEIQSFSREFDQVIYPKERQFFGDVPNPGVDRDPRVTILLQDLGQGNGGYFDTVHAYDLANVPDSNRREMIFISAEALRVAPNLARFFLAHELQHLISFNQKELLRGADEEIWLNEARSEYAVTVVGYNDTLQNSNLARRKALFLEKPSDSLVEWPNVLEDYSTINFFGDYLVQRVGQGVFGQTLQGGEYGIPSINNYLRSHGYTENFLDLFIDWMAASYLNDQSVDLRYGYSRDMLEDIRVPAQYRVTGSPALTEYLKADSIKPWQPVWYEYDFSNQAVLEGQSLKVEVVGQGTDRFALGYIAYFSDRPPQVGRLVTNATTGSGGILNQSGTLQKVVLLLTSSGRESGFGASEFGAPLTVKVTSVSTESLASLTLQDGALIKNASAPELYVIERGYRRYLSPEVVRLYGHLDPARAISVTPEIFNSYKPANYVRYVNDEKVYAVWPDNTKHWLNMTGEYFAQSGRDWGAVFIINDLELNLYQTGADVVR